ncbi:CaaX protease [Xylariomycetidae sp. FL0641]|nr:CaaX protease [Xylariomycetidae sp. FL0641]
MPSISGFLTRYLTKDKPKPPPITVGTAVFLLVLYTVLYVAPFYLSSTTRPSLTLSRDDARVIRARVTSVSLTCAVCSAATFWILTSTAGSSSRDALHALGWYPVGVAEAARTLLLTAVLFAAPLYEALLVDGGWRDVLDVRGYARELWTQWTSWRNIVAVSVNFFFLFFFFPGRYLRHRPFLSIYLHPFRLNKSPQGPVTEEILFRSASVPLLTLAGTSPARTVFLAPLVFGLAHAHHFYEFRVTHPRVPAAAGVARSVVQFGYTTLFGAYATFVFLRTGSLAAIVAVHAFCNLMGLPRFWGRVGPPGHYRAYEQRRPVGRDDDGKDDEEEPPPALVWSLVYYAILVAGAVAWYRNLGPLTQSGNALVRIDV